MIPKNTIIAFLIFTAVLLTCVLALQHFTFNDASAWANHSSRAGRYVVATTIFDNTRSLYWVANVDVQNLTVFGFVETGGFTPLDSRNLNYVFRPLTPQQMDPRLMPGTRIRSGDEAGQTTTDTQIRPPQRTDQSLKLKKTEPNIIRF
ncbi:MAG: hypothetical protein AMJ79_11250 [Phycisphaerae bacterium SM23_30]|nr:MAG: hypothetical protein AMJ79_11250 [Phycisphaerae bacterium SM23_30]